MNRLIMQLQDKFDKEYLPYCSSTIFSSDTDFLRFNFLIDELIILDKKFKILKGEHNEKSRNND